MHAFLSQLNWELKRLFARRRTYIGFGAFLLLDVLIVILAREPLYRLIETRLSNNGLEVEEYFSGTTLGLMLLAASCVLLGGIFAALVSGDIVAKEWEDGTLRMLMSRPVSRFRLILLKYLACQIYSAVFFTYVGVAALCSGLALRGWGSLFVFIPDFHIFAMFDPWEGLSRYLLAMVLLVFSMSTLTSLGFFFSCLKIRPAAATIVAFAYYLIDFILAHFEGLEGYRWLFLSPRMAQWIKAFVEIIPWPAMIQAYALLLGVNLTAFILGWLLFQQRDLKS